MNNTTTVWAKLLPDVVSDDGTNFIIETQQSGFKLFNGVGLRLRVALFEPDKTTIRDVSDITSLTHYFKNGSNTYNTQVKAGGFPAITADQWAAREAYHAEFAYSDVNMALTAASSYSSAVICNTADALAAVDFLCKRPLTILESGLPSVYTQPNDDPTLLKALLDAVLAKLGDKVDVIGQPGATITLTSSDPKKRFILDAVDDPDQGLIFSTTPEILP